MFLVKGLRQLVLKQNHKALYNFFNGFVLYVYTVFGITENIPLN